MFAKQENKSDFSSWLIRVILSAGFSGAMLNNVACIWQIAVQVLANLNVAKLEGCGDAATHDGSTLAPIRRRLTF
jgi:hypothetical protein